MTELSEDAALLCFPPDLLKIFPDKKTDPHKKNVLYYSATA
jgi:hypothetical protein